jgi:hypothetical protein
MLAMDTMYLDSIMARRPAGYFLQPIGFMQYGTDNQSSRSDYILNNYGGNVNLPLKEDRQINASASELKYILHWNEAYGGRTYAFGFGRVPFYEHRCPETRCVTTEDR